MRDLGLRVGICKGLGSTLQGDEFISVYEL